MSNINKLVKEDLNMTEKAKKEHKKAKDTGRVFFDIRTVNESKENQKEK